MNDDGGIGGGKRGSRKKQPAAAGAAPDGFKFIVGIGASAGGLTAFGQLLKSMPKKTGLAFIIIQHLDPKQDSILSELISRSTDLPVSVAEDNQQVEPDHVYVIPPNKEMGIYNGRISLSDRPAGSGRHLPIDHFFQSLAEDQGTRAIGIVLSGTASDGTVGLAAIKARNGMTFAQDPETTDYNGMPQAAIRSGVVDFVGAPQKIGEQLIHIIKHPFAPKLIQQAAAETMGVEESDLNKVFILLRNATGADFSYYKRSTVERRIMRRMILLKLHSLSDYVEYMQGHAEEAELLFQDLLIRVTSFFREPETFEILKEKVFPKVAEIKENNDPWRVWVPGCSTGEEAYSVAIVLLEFFEDQGINSPLQVFATDINDTAIDRARMGVYPESAMENVSRARLGKFFQKVEGGYQVFQLVREQCIFATHDIVRNPPFSRLDFVSFRNVLIYLDSSAQQRVIPILHYALSPWGYLMLGSSESVVDFSDLIKVVDKQHSIYAKKPKATVHQLVDNETLGVHVKKPAADVEAAKESDQPLAKFDIQGEANHIVLSSYSPPGVIIDGDMNIIQFRGKTGEYLEHAPGRANFNILGMAREGLGVEIRTSVFNARKEKKSTSKSGIPLGSYGALKEVKITTIPLEAPADEEYYLILFEAAEEKEEEVREKEEGEGKPEAGGRSGRLMHDEMEQLRSELDSTKESLQSMIEDQERNNEELRAANEEIQSSNEELQSINEELETAKEELQSTNEELTTVNEELEHRNEQLSITNDHMVNLLNSIDVPIIILDSRLRIRLFTPGAQDGLNIIAGDVGRQITDINIGVPVNEIEKIAQEVMEKVVMREEEIQGKGGRWHLVRVRPYLTTEKKIDGVVISFQDIDEMKKLTEDLDRYNKLLRALNGINNEINAIHDRELLIAHVTNMAVEALGADAGLMVSLDNEQRQVMFSQGLPEDLSGMAVGENDLPVVMKAIEDKRPETVNRTGNLKLLEKSIIRKFKVESMMVVPLVRGERAIGGIAIFYLGEARELSDAELDFACNLAASASLALENARLFKQLGL